MGIHEKERKKNERTNREQTLALSRSPSPRFFFVFKSDIRSIETNVCIYHLFKDRYTLGEQTARMLQCIPTGPGESRGVEKELLRNDDGTARVDGN